MKKEIYDGLVSKLATVVPWFAKSIIDMAIERAGKRTYKELSPIEMLSIIKNDINPRMASQLPGYSSLLTAGAGLAVTDRDDRIVFVNPFLQKILSPLLLPLSPGAAREDDGSARGEQMFEILQGVGLIKPMKDVKRVEVREFYCADLKKHLNISIVPLTALRSSGAAEGSELGLCCVVQDITLREAIEAEIETFFAELNEIRTVLERKNEELQRMQDELVQQAYVSGMVEIATTVLHNVGNAINSVSIRIGEIAKDAGLPLPAQLLRICETLEQRKADLSEYLARDTTGSKVLPFMKELIDELEAVFKRIHDNAVDRCGHAANVWQGAGRSDPAGAARAQGPLHVWLHRERHRRARRAGVERGAHRKADRSLEPIGQDPGSLG